MRDNSKKGGAVLVDEENKIMKLCYDVAFKAIFLNCPSILYRMISDITDIDIEELNKYATIFNSELEIKHIIDGQELYTFYAHLSAIGVKKGQEVEQGYIIGKEGGDPYTDQNAGNSTGHHLHFEVRTASGYGNSINPKEFIY